MVFIVDFQACANDPGSRAAIYHDNWRFINQAKITPGLSIPQIRSVIIEYVRSIDNLDMNLARKVWSAAGEVAFIHPGGTEHGLDNILQNFYGNTMAAFSKRELMAKETGIHVYGDTAWSELHWTFHATVKNGGQEITTHGRETKIYRKEDGTWRIVDVHYSEMPETGALKGFSHLANCRNIL